MPVYTVASKSSVDYAWDFPAASEKRLVLSINGSRRAVDIMEIGDLMPFRFSVCISEHRNIFDLMVAAGTEQHTRRLFGRSR